MNDKNEPVAWAFYNTDGTLRFIIDNKQRMEAWKTAHQGTIVPLIPLVDNRERKENNV